MSKFELGDKTFEMGRAGLGIAFSSVLLTQLFSQSVVAQVLVPAGSEAATFTEQGIRFEGTTGGELNLMGLARRDRRRRLCLGYGNAEPDHVLILAEDVARLSLAVESNGGDTTLLVEGPRGIDCNDNVGRNNRDAAVRGSNWPAGTYRIWVGSFDQGDRVDYKLLISSPNQR